MADQTPAPLGTPGPLTQAAIDKAKTLPDNQLAIDAGTSDFRTVDASIGLKKTWRNGWGAGMWIGAKIGAGKPVGSAGVTVTKTLGLLGGVPEMNWLQRNLPSRESWAWVIATVAGALAYVLAEFETFQAAFEIAPIWEVRIKLAAGLFSVLAAKQSMSWVPMKATKTLAKEAHEIEKHLNEELRKPPTS